MVNFSDSIFGHDFFNGQKIYFRWQYFSLLIASKPDEKKAGFTTYTKVNLFFLLN